MLRLQPEERLAEDEYESFLPAIVERSGEFETLANENIVPDFEQVPSRKSSSGEKIGAGIPAVNLEAASDVRVENQEVQPKLTLKKDITLIFEIRYYFYQRMCVY